SLRVNHATVAVTELDGPLLVQPEGMRLTKGDGGGVLELAEERPDLLVGEMPLVWWDRKKRSLEVSFLEVSPPPPFSTDDITVMWSQIVESSLAALPARPGQGRALGRARPAGSWLRPEAVPRALLACRRILS